MTRRRKLSKLPSRRRSNRTTQERACSTMSSLMKRSRPKRKLILMAISPPPLRKRKFRNHNHLKTAWQRIRTILTRKLVNYSVLVFQSFHPRMLNTLVIILKTLLRSLFFRINLKIFTRQWKSCSLALTGALDLKPVKAGWAQLNSIRMLKSLNTWENFWIRVLSPTTKLPKKLRKSRKSRI